MKKKLVLIVAIMTLLTIFLVKAYNSKKTESFANTTIVLRTPYQTRYFELRSNNILVTWQYTGSSFFPMGNHKPEGFTPEKSFQLDDRQYNAILDQIKKWEEIDFYSYSFSSAETIELMYKGKHYQTAVNRMFEKNYFIMRDLFALLFDYTELSN